MKLENLVAVSGMPGLFKMAANRSNGLIIEDLNTGKHKFVSARKHQFTPLETTAIYTDDGDSTPLAKVFRNMFEQLEDNPPLEVTAKADELHEYFTDILPTYDKNQVKTSDIRKVVKWFTLLKEMGWTPEEESKEVSEEAKEK